MVTGVYRSGTTFIERALDNDPAYSVASQPFPHLYLHAKRGGFDRVGFRRIGCILLSGHRRDARQHKQRAQDVQGRKLSHG